MDYDFTFSSGAIELGFNTAISKDRPYERATAQFRKEQFDSAARVGDQSLTGWWTRGQLSFHRGAGVKYYEVLEGETILDRFTDCEGLTVSEPGQVTLAPRLTGLSLNATDATPAPLSRGGGVFALTPTGIKHTAGASSTDLPTSTGTVPTSITSSGDLYYVANGTKIERQAVGFATRTNLITNPSFETDTAGWSVSANGATLTRVTSGPFSGGSCARIVPASAFDDANLRFTASGLAVGQTYTFSIYVRTDTGTTGLQMVANGSGSGTTFDAGTSWTRLSRTFTANAITSVVGFNQANGIRTYYVDAAMVEQASSAGTYFDGSLPGCAWVGTPHGSQSTAPSLAPATVSTARVTLSGGASWSNVWWAKGRLWAVDTAGYFYALSDTVATVTNADAFWNSGRGAANWMLTDSPGVVYISDGSNIYAVTVATDGLVPSLDTPTTVAQVPVGETISSLTYYLGNIVVATSAGVRIALIQNGQVFLGPLVIEGDFSETGRAGVWNTTVYVVGRVEGRGGSYVLCAIDLSQQISDLVYAWSPVKTLSTIASAANGAVVDATGRLYTWSGGDTYLSSRNELASDGYLATGFHRFGTLDPKWFRSVLVRVGGSGGSVDVYRRDPDGSSYAETLLGTITYPNTEAELDLGPDVPAERVAIKFVLNRDASDSSKAPVLLGYQLKALPQPRRQRMIRVPLLLFDSESNRTGQKMLADPWERLAALEALEEENAVVEFSDNETGETGTAYIEAIEVQRGAPPAAGSGGFGGFIFITLRKVNG